MAALAAAASCTYPQFAERAAPKKDVAFARECLDHLRSGQLDEVERRMDPALLRPGTREKLAAASAYFPAGEPRSVELIAANVGSDAGRWSGTFSFQYEFERQWMVAAVALQRKDGASPVVTGINVDRLPDSLQRIHAFRLGGKGAVNYLFLVAAMVVAAFVVATLVACVRARDMPKRWRWALFILFGVTGTSLNWTTGHVMFEPFSAHLFGADAMRASPYAPWIVTVGFPLGAVAFLVKRFRDRAPRTRGRAAPSGTDAFRWR